MIAHASYPHKFPALFRHVLALLLFILFFTGTTPETRSGLRRVIHLAVGTK